MSNQNNQDYQDELDVYQAAWVLGRQRGVENPIDAKMLKKLVDAGRIKPEWLNENERLSINLPKPKFQSTSKNKPNSLEMVRTVVKLLLKDIELEFEDVVSKEEWDKFDKKKQDKLRLHFFNLMYGTSPQFFAFDLAKRIEQ